jgi:hypothetical protein
LHQKLNYSTNHGSYSHSGDGGHVKINRQWADAVESG